MAAVSKESPRSRAHLNCRLSYANLYASDRPLTTRKPDLSTGLSALLSLLIQFAGT